jgi:hypothetical protein
MKGGCPRGLPGEEIDLRGESEYNLSIGGWDRG